MDDEEDEAPFSPLSVYCYSVLNQFRAPVASESYQVVIIITIRVNRMIGQLEENIGK
jgi:hypothetical protein